MPKELEISACYIQTVDYGDYIDGERLNINAVRGYSKVKLQVPIPESVDPRGLDVVIEQHSISIKIGEWEGLYETKHLLDANDTEGRTARVLRRRPELSFKIPGSFYLELIIPILRDETQLLADARKQLDEVTRIKSDEQPVDAPDGNASGSSREEVDSSTEDQAYGTLHEGAPDTATAVADVSNLPQKSRDFEDPEEADQRLQVEPLTEIRPGTSQPVIELSGDGLMTLQSLKKLAVGWQRNTNHGKVEDKAAQKRQLEQIHREYASQSPTDGISFEFQGFVFTLLNPELSAAYSSQQ